MNKNVRSQKTNQIIFFVSIIIFILFSTMTVSCENNSKLSKTHLVITRQDGSQVSLEAELALTEQEQAKGYMERKNIPDGTGMLFVFKSDEIRNFWMKNTPHPLSIAYIDSDGKIRDILDMTPFSLANVTSSVYVRYALEVPQGWFQKENIEVGDKVTTKDASLKSL